jgi:MtaA/CmuA family methyltransferase
MNSYERYVATLRGKHTDFVPRVPILMQFAAEFIGSNYGAFASNYEVLVQANEACALEFGIDQLSCISDPYRETQGFGGIIEYRTDGVPRCKSPLEEDRDLSRLQRPDPYSSERMVDRIRAVEAYRNRFKGEYSILGWIEGPAAEAADLRGTVNFLYDLMDDPDYAAELMDVTTETGIAFALAQIEAGADTIGIGDAIASQISPKLYESLILPREKRLVDAIRSHGAFVKLHICGNITHLLPGIATLEVDVLDVDHMVDLRKVREAVGSNVTITGNIDPVNGVSRGTPASIREQILSCYRSAGGRYMVNAGCEIPAGTPVENLKALCEPIPIG